MKIGKSNTNMKSYKVGILIFQVNLEYLGRVVFNTSGLLYPDSVVGTDSHTTMIDGLGVAGWGVGGIEAEAAMLGQVLSSVLLFSFSFIDFYRLSTHDVLF